jgi:hypothetical protein
VEKNRFLSYEHCDFYNLLLFPLCLAIEKLNKTAHLNQLPNPIFM